MVVNSPDLSFELQCCRSQFQRYKYFRFRRLLVIIGVVLAVVENLRFAVGILLTSVILWNYISTSGLGGGHIAIPEGVKRGVVRGLVALTLILWLQKCHLCYVENISAHFTKFKLCTTRFLSCTNRTDGQIAFLLTPKHVTLNDLEWPFCIIFCFAPVCLERWSLAFEGWLLLKL